MVKIDKQVVVSFETDMAIKEAVEKIFLEKYNLSIEQACILFLEKCIEYQGIPFEIKL